MEPTGSIGVVGGPASPAGYAPADSTTDPAEHPKMDRSRPAPRIPGDTAARTGDLTERVAALVAEMTLDEKLSQLSYQSAAIERLGIHEYNWWNECLHGLARAGRATVFPQTIGLAATFDRELCRRVADTIATEARARYHATIRATGGSSGQYQGLTFWTPNINIFRDPRWGRGQETWGEDPFLTAELASAFVHGLQGDDPDYLKVAACAKHYAVHSGPEAARHRFDARVNHRDLWETYLPAFERLVAEGVESVMGAYNRVNGHAACAHPELLVDILRNRWGFSGHVVSDCWAINDFHMHHGLTGSAMESAALAVNSGCDLNCGEAYESMRKAIDAGLVSEATIDQSVTRLLKTRMRLGQFDPPESVPFSNYPIQVIECDEHRELARQAASHSVVLLKNRSVLPFKPELKRIFLVGPNAASIDALLGNYSGLGKSLVTLAEGLSERLPDDATLEYRQGYQLYTPNLNPIDWSPHESSRAELTVFAGGLSNILEGEEGEAIASPLAGDRGDISLPECQAEGIRKLAERGNPIVLVLFSGAPIALGDIADLVDAVIWVGYPGCEGGRAVAQTMFGDINPAGRLPMTWPVSSDDLPAFEDYSMQGRTYRYATKAPLYPFGYGLSYSTFEYETISVSSEGLTAGAAMSVDVSIRNMSDRDGEEVVQLYTRRIDADAGAPLLSLRAFDRVQISAGEAASVSLTIDAEMLREADNSGERVLHAGQYEVIVAPCAPVQGHEDSGLRKTFTVNI